MTCKTQAHTDVGRHRRSNKTDNELQVSLLHGPRGSLAAMDKPPQGLRREKRVDFRGKIYQELRPHKE